MLSNTVFAMFLLSIYLMIKRLVLPFHLFPYVYPLFQYHRNRGKGEGNDGRCKQVAKENTVSEFSASVM